MHLSIMLHHVRQLKKISKSYGWNVFAFIKKIKTFHHFQVSHVRDKDLGIQSNKSLKKDRETHASEKKRKLQSSINWKMKEKKKKKKEEEEAAVEDKAWSATVLAEDEDTCYCNLCVCVCVCVCVFFFFIWCSLCLLFICWASVEFVLAQTVYLLSKCDRRLFFIFWSNVVCVFLISGSFFLFSLQISLFKIWNYQISFRSLFSSCSFISSGSDHKFILVYWPNSSEKLKQKETVRTSKTGHGLQNRTVGPRSVQFPAFFVWNGSSP